MSSGKSSSGKASTTKNEKSTKIESTQVTKVVSTPVVTASTVLTEDDKKKIQNAPRRISKIEAALEKHEIMMNDLDNQMIEVLHINSLILDFSFTI